MPRPLQVLLIALRATALALLPSTAWAQGPVYLHEEVRCVSVRRGTVKRTACTVRSQPVESAAPARRPAPLPQATPPAPAPARDELDELDEELQAELLADEDFTLEDTPEEAELDEVVPEDPELPAPDAESRPAPDVPRQAAPAPDAESIEPAPERAAPSSRLAAEEQQVLELLNRERAQRGLGQLERDATATLVARSYSRQMCERRFFDHTSPDGKQPWDRLKDAGVRFSAAAENIAVGYSSAAAVHQGWMTSPGHRTNRLNPIYGRTGVGAHLCGSGVVFWTEVFMR